MKLFSKQHEIEKLGFTYEPDKDKCKIFKTNVYYGTIHVWGDGKNVEKETVMVSEDYDPKQYRDAIAQSCPFICVHSFEVPDDNPPTDGHWDVWVCVRGHTRKEEADVLKQVLGDDKSKEVREWLDSLPEINRDVAEGIYLKGYQDRQL